MIEIIEGAWAAGETKTFMLQGEYFEVLDAQYPLTVYMMDRQGAQLSTMKNAEASFFSKPGRFECVQVYSAQAQYLRAFIGSGDAGTRRISSTVQVIDGERARTNAGVMFAGTATPNPVAGQRARAQLWNPIGTAKRLIVSRIVLSAGSVQTLNVTSSMAAEANDVTASLAANKLLGGPAPAAQLRHGNNAVGVATSMFGVTLAAGGVFDWKPAGVIVVPPGTGLLIGANDLNSSMSVNYEWFEEAI
ncbi:hypothetical protein [Variovorax sp. 3P27G3]|uniref:hypothetical protein n=1 Tax=Variovorax sp. 3P27G3 TaxID=2502214 RepID=UPI0010F60229|nr:hypothetical protein [Variovorax sp. 3P27G3]